MLTFLKLLDPVAGSIVIDDLSLAHIPRETLRSKIITVTQDQFVLPGSIHDNIDPFGSYSKSDALAALHAVGLSPFVNEQKDGLDTKFTEDSLSHGQKQLFFVARAVLRKNVGRLVLLDEATSR